MCVLQVPIYLKWMLVYEEPETRTLWLGKALPREWLAVGEAALSVQRATTRYGRISFTLRRESVTTVHANITLLRPPFAATSALAPPFPPGGLKLRVRVPLNMVLAATSAGVLNTTEQTVSFDRATWPMRATTDPPHVQPVVVTLRRRVE